MKSIVNGKRYDTETAESVYTYRFSHPGDFQGWDATLYKTKSGRWFLHGVGGPASPYAHKCDSGGWNGGSKIVALTEEEAKDWLSGYNPTEAEKFWEFEEA